MDMTVDTMLEAVLAVCGTIAIIGGATVVIGRWIRPALSISSRVNALEARSERDYKKIEQMERLLAANCRATLALLAHAASGNDTGKIQDAQEDLTNALIGRQ
jgi:hypothetical protein